MINIKVFWYTALTFICFICFSFEDTDALDATKAIYCQRTPWKIITKALPTYE